MQQPEADIKNLCVWTSSDNDPSLQEWLPTGARFLLILRVETTCLSGIGTIPGLLGHGLRVIPSSRALWEARRLPLSIPAPLRV